MTNLIDSSSNVPPEFSPLQPVTIKAVLKRVRSYETKGLQVSQRFEWQRVVLDTPLLGIIKDKRTRTNGGYEPYRSWYTNTSNGADWDETQAAYYSDTRITAYTVRLLGKRKDVVALPEDLEVCE